MDAAGIGLGKNLKLLTCCFYAVLGGKIYLTFGKSRMYMDAKGRVSTE